MIRNIFVPIFAITFVSTALADTEFEDSVPLELVKALIGNTPFGESRIFSDLSSDFPSIDIPDDLILMGSIERGYGVAAVFSTDLSASQTDSALDVAFIQSGYVQFETPGMEGPQTGFVSSMVNAPRIAKRYCHDAFGFLTTQYSEKEQNGIVTLSSNYPNDNRSCAAQLGEQQQAMGRRGGSQIGLQQYFPRMELPEEVAQRRAPFFGLGGWSGSSSSMETKAGLNIDWDIEEVFEHFMAQIDAQQWAIDSQNIGTSSAIGVWTRSPVSGTDLIGTLTILKTGEETFELKFQLTSTGANNSSNSPFFRNI